MTPDPTPPAAPPPTRRWRRRLLGFVVLLGTVVWIAPFAVARSSLRDRIVAAAAADLRGTVTVGGMSAGWFSPVELRDVTVRDPQGRTVLTVPRLVTSRTLLRLVWHRADPGDIEVHSPAVTVECDRGRTNLEDVLAGFLEDDGRPTPANRTAVRVHVTDGTLTLRDEPGGESAVFTGVEATAAVPADRAVPIDLTLNATAAGGSPGSVEAVAAIGPEATADVKVVGLPLRSFAALLPRVAPGLRLSGTVTADVKARWSADGGANLDGTVAAADLDVSGPLLNGERLLVPTADLSAKAEITGGRVRVGVTGGRLVLSDAPGSPPVEFAAITAEIRGTLDGKEPVAGRVAVELGGPARGRLEAEGSIGERGSATLKAVGFPLAALRPVLRRVEPGASLGGTLTADLTAGWDGAFDVRVEGNASVRDLDLGGPWLKGDRLRLASAELPVKAELRGRTVRVEKAELTCDVGRLAASGTFDAAQPSDRLLDQPGVKLDVDLDLARLAAVLPTLLRVREGTEVREGRLTASLASRGGPGGTSWDGSIRASALKAVRDGKPIEWPEPLAVEFSARAPSGQLPVFDKVLCKSDFIAVNAQGSAESVRAAANVYLDRLAARLGEFVDLGGVTLAGEASAWVVGTRNAAGAFKADAGAELKNFRFAVPGVRGVSEPHVSLKAHAAGLWPATGPVRLDAATAELIAGSDHLEARLTAPVPDLLAAHAGRVSARMTGDLGRWAARARGFVGIPPEYVFGGTVEAAGTFALGPAAVTGEQLAVAVTHPLFRGAGLDLDERVLHAAGTMMLTRATGTVVFTPVTVTCPALNVRDGRFTFEFPAKEPMVITGAGLADSDLNRLAATLRLQATADGPDSIHGRGVGPLRFRWQGDVTAFSGTVDATDFALGPPTRPAWRETRLKVDLDGRYDSSAGRYTIATGRVERPGLAAEGKGTWANLDTTQDVDLAGTLSYDLAALSPELRNAIGGGFQASGKGSRPFALRGSLSPPGGKGGSLAGNAAVGWEVVRAFGFEMGPGELAARVENGVGTVSPITATFGGGRVHLEPRLKLDTIPGEVSFAKGRVVEKAKLTPAVCAGAVGYALPVIANAAQAEGEISFDLDDNRVPLADPTAAVLRGRLQVHKAVVSAGPVVSEVVQLLGESAPRVVLATEIAVPVRVEGGRVYHENLTLTVNGYAVKTTGSVGFDGSLALVAEVPIPGTVPGLKTNPALKKALEGKVIRVPIGGTMAKPAVDRGAFHAAVAGVAREAAKDAVKDAGRELFQRELDRLFPGGAPGVMSGGSSNPPAGGQRPLFPLPGLPVPKK